MRLSLALAQQGGAALKYTHHAQLYRGGTSRGLLLGDKTMVMYDQETRDKILCQVGSPDPDGRQIDGFGGGTSSTSKVAIVHSSLSIYPMMARKAGIPLPGLPWIDEAERASEISDVVYRFGQVSVKEAAIDWGSTCGNMVAAAARHAISRSFAGRTPGFLRDIEDEDEAGTQMWPIRILAHDTGKVVIARVPVTLQEQSGRTGRLRWLPALTGDTRIAGVPGTAPGTIIESPLEGSVLPTGNQRDVVEIDGKQIEISVVDTGLPVVFVSAKSLDIPLAQLLEHPTTIESNTELMAKLEQVRDKACSLSPQLRSVFSVPSPKLCVVHPRTAYSTTGGEKMTEDSMDLLVRIVSSGQLHRTVPATTLSALAAARCFPNSVVAEETNNSRCAATKTAEEEFTSTSNASGDAMPLQSITVGQPAGLSSASVRLDAAGKPTATLMMRTARLILNGSFETYEPPSSMSIYKALNDESDLASARRGERGGRGGGRGGFGGGRGGYEGSGGRGGFGGSSSRGGYEGSSGRGGFRGRGGYEGSSGRGGYSRPEGDRPQYTRSEDRPARYGQDGDRPAYRRPEGGRGGYQRSDSGNGGSRRGLFSTRD